MPNLDSCHQQITNALAKAGWQIEARMYYLQYEGFEVYPDIRARQTNGTVEEIIVVEVKCFAEKSNYRDDLYRAIGQYLIYRSILGLKQIDAKPYLAIPSFAYEGLFTGKVVSATISDSNISLLVVDIEREVIVQWLG